MFRNWFKENKLLIIVIGVLFLCLVIGWILYALFGHQLIEAMYEGRSIGVLNRIIGGQVRHPVEDYFKRADELFFNFIFLTLILFIIIYLANKNLKGAKRHIFFMSIFICLLVFTYNSIHINLTEDAHIMFRYAKNLANGYGLTWNIGKDPVEGATAFLWTILLAGWHKLGFAYEVIVPLLNGLFIILTTMLIYFSSIRLFKLDIKVVLIAACVLVTSPLVIQMRGGFETPMFSFFMTALTISCMALIFCSEQIKKYCLHIIPVSGLLLGLTRPEGVIFFALIFLSSIVILSKKERPHFIKLVVLWFMLPGIVYFIWRWSYFGYLFPNTFYAKSMIGSGSLYTILKRGGRNLLWLVMFLAPYIFTLCLYVLKAKSYLRWKIMLLLIPLAIFPFSYFMIFQVQNIGHRFQISILPSYLVLFSVGLYSFYNLSHIPLKRWKEQLFLYFSVGFIAGGLFLTLWFRKPVLTLIFLLIAGIYMLGRDSIIVGFKRHQKKLLSLALLILGLLLIFRSYQSTVSAGGIGGGHDDRIIIGKSLKPFSDKGYVMLSSEAGLLPYYSEWITIDPAGLYDEHIAHNGLSMEYLGHIKPDLIMFHVYSSKWTENMGGNYWGGKWNLMVQKMYRYAEENNYILVAIVQKRSPNNVHWYYLKNDCPDKDGIIKAITNHNELVYSKKYMVK